MPDDAITKLQSLRIDRSEESATRRPSWTVAIGMAVGLAILAGAAGYLGGGSRSGERDNASPTAETARSNASAAAPTLAPQPARASGLIASGFVVARRQATVSSEISGKITEMRFEEGDVVSKGDILARLDDELARADFNFDTARAAAARAQIAALEADLVEANRVLARNSALGQRDLIGQAAVDSARAAVDSLTARIANARAEADAARINAERRAELLERHIVRAPFAGVIIAKNAQAGEIVSPGSAGGGFTRTGVYTLVDMTSLEVEVDVGEAQIGRVQPGAPVEVTLDSYPDWRIPARVRAIIPRANRDRATIFVRVAFDGNDARILPDMAAKVTFPIDNS